LQLAVFFLTSNRNLLLRGVAEACGWEEVTFLNHGSPDSNESLAQHLAEWRSACPEDLPPFVKRLAAVFEIKL